MPPAARNIYTQHACNFNTHGWPTSVEALRTLSVTTTPHLLQLNIQMSTRSLPPTPPKQYPSFLLISFLPWVVRWASALPRASVVIPRPHWQQPPDGAVGPGSALRILCNSTAVPVSLPTSTFWSLHEPPIYPCPPALGLPLRADHELRELPSAFGAIMDGARAEKAVSYG